MRRRHFLAGVAASSLVGCGRDAAPRWHGGFVGASEQRGHRLRAPASDRLPGAAVQRRADVLIVGAGIAGLAAARALVRGGIDDVQLLELEDEPGGNSRAHRMAGIDCPLGAHYLPLPGPHADEVSEVLEEFGVTRRVAGRVVVDERHLCHSPQERLYIDGRWQEGVLPDDAGDAELRAQYRTFGAAIDAQRKRLAFAMPSARAAWTADHAALDAITFAEWLDTRRLDHPKLRWYLDYCCSDDYGAGAAQVSAWAGVHYFASRHGFHAPGDEEEPSEALLTWSQGNAWLATRLAAPHSERLHVGRIAQRVIEGRHDAGVDVWDVHAQRAERWTARTVVLAVPLFVAARLLDAPPAALREAAVQLRYAPWLVANLHLSAPLAERAGTVRCWDNVLYGAASLGYVDATHQSLSPHPGPTVLTSYWPFGSAARAWLHEVPWAACAQRVIDELAGVHPDLERKLTQVDLMRYGHAMSIPLPGSRGSPALRRLSQASGRVRYAHSDLSAYSVFEEAFHWGHQAGASVARELRS